MKQSLIITILLLFNLNSYAHIEKECVYEKNIQEIVLDGVVERNGEFFCQFKGIDLFGIKDEIQEINCSEIMTTCSAELEIGDKVWAEVIIGPNPMCHQTCGCGRSSEITNLLGAEVCEMNLSPPARREWCETTACGCGAGCPKEPLHKAPFCEDYLPGLAPANCVNGPNWPGRGAK